MKKFLLILMTGILGLILLPSSAFAAAPVSDEVNSIARIQISALSVQVLLGLLVPIAVGLITKVTTTSKVKVILTLVLNAVQALIVQATMADGTAIIDKSTFIAWVIALVVSIASYLGVYKPIRLTSSDSNGLLGPNKGLF